MEDKVSVKILEVAEGEVVMIIGTPGRTSLREAHLPRSQLPITYAVERRSEARAALNEPEGPSPAFVREGQHWRVAFEGSVALLDDTVGVRHLARLLASPGQKIRCDSLLALLAGEPQAPPIGPAEKASDARALRAYQARMEELAGELIAAQTAGDGERILTLTEEYEKLGEHLRTVTGKNGQSRREVDGLERARQAVSAAIRRTMKVLKGAHLGLWRHLYKHLKVGLVCEYSPDPPVTWITS